MPFSKSDKDSPLWADVNRKITKLVEKGVIDKNKAAELKTEAEQALINSFEPSYRSLISWFKNDIDNTDEISQGVGSQLNGRAFYNFRLKSSTTTSLTADEIHQIGLNEVARLTKEMEAIKNKVNFKGSLKEFFTFIKTDDRFFYPNTDEGRLGYITDSKRYLAFINQQLPKYFGILPKAALEVKRVEAFREQDGALNIMLVERQTVNGQGFIMHIYLICVVCQKMKWKPLLIMKVVQVIICKFQLRKN